MKNVFLRSLYLILALISFSLPVTFCMQDLEGFNLSDEEKQKLDQELEQFVNAFNNLSPEQMQELEELNRMLEQDMINEGLDPKNIDDVLKWAEKEAQKALEQEQEEEETPTEPIKESITPVDFKTLGEDSDASAMLLNLITYISELRQKSIAYDEMNKKLERFSSEFNELSYFLHSLTNPDLMKHLMSKDFEALYQNLQAFYQILAKQVPLIQSKEIEETDIENPYQSLGLSNQASLEEVEDAYQNLKEMFDPSKIEEQLKKQNIAEQEIAKTVKQSKISFSFIQDAYDQLKDPKQKAILDRKVREEANNQKQIEKSSYQAFDEIYNVFTDKLFPILSDIKKLFEKYKPEEITKAKQYDDREKKLLAESKKPFRVIKGESGRSKYHKDGGEYDEFYKHLSQKDRNKAPSSYKPFFDDNFDSDFFSNDRGTNDKAPADKPKGKGDEKKGGKPDEKKDDKKKDDAKKDDKKDGQGKGSDAKKPVDKDAEVLGEIGLLSKLLEDAKKLEKKVIVKRKNTLPTRGNGDDKPISEELEIKIDKVKEGLNKYLTSAPVSEETSEEVKQKDLEPLNDFLDFAKQYNIESIATGLKKVAPADNKKIENEAIAKMLKDKVVKHKSLVESWYNDFYPLLDPSKRHESKDLAAMNITKQNIHSLGTTSSSKEAIAEAALRAKSAGAAYPYIKPENLYKVKEFIKGMYTSMQAIEKALEKPEASK